MKNVFANSITKAIYLLAVLVLATGVSGSFATTYSSSAVVQQAGIVAAGATNQAILRIAVTGGGGGAAFPVCSMTFTMNNSTTPSNALLFYTATTATFSTTTQLGSTIANPTGNITFTFTQTHGAGTFYYWLAYDIPGGAANCSTFDASMPANSITYSGAGGSCPGVSSAQPGTPNPSGERTVSPDASNGTYCLPTYTNACSSNDYINDFSIGSINNSASGCNGGSSNYKYYCSNTTDLVQGGVYVVSLTVGPFQESSGLWIDFNRNGTLNDAGEFFNLGTLAASTSGTTGITIPSGASLGATKMRVRCSFGATALVTGDVCNNKSYGECEDYTVTIIAPAATCTNTILDDNEADVDCGGASCGPCLECASHCRVTGTSSAYGYLSNVQIIDNNVSPSSILLDYSSNYDGYVCTGQGAGLQRTLSYDISVTMSNSSTSGRWTAAWIDFNGDGDYLDADENIMAAASNGSSGIQTRAAVTFAVPAGAKIGITKMRVVWKYNNGNPAPTSCDAFSAQIDWEDYDISINLEPTNMYFYSAKVYQNNTTSVNAGTTKQEVISVKITTIGDLNPIAATSFTLNTTGTPGTTNDANDLTGARFWTTGSSSTFATTTQLGSNVVNPTGAFTFNGFSYTLSTGDNYFWLTYDVKATAPGGDVIDAKCTSLIVDGVTKNAPADITPSDPAGSRPIIASTNMAVVSSTVTQNTDPVAIGTTDNQVIGIQIVTSGAINPTSATTFTFNTTGTSATVTSQIANAKLWSTQDNSVFSATTQVGSTVAAPNGVFTISPSVAQGLLLNGTNYFWLTYDVQSGAGCNPKQIDAQCTLIQFTNGSPVPPNSTPSPSAPSGARVINCGTPYYSKGDLAANLLSSWSLTRDGTGASPASFSSAYDFYIQNGDRMTTTATQTIPNLYLEAGSYITTGNIITSTNMTIMNNATYEQLANGADANYITNFTIKSGGTWLHNNTGYLPGATGAPVVCVFEANSSQYMKLWGAQTWPGGANAVSWGNLTLDYPANTSNWDIQQVLMTVQGNLEFRNSNGKLFVHGITETINVGGNLIFSGNTKHYGVKGSNNVLTWNVKGDLIVSSASSLIWDYCSSCAGYGNGSTRCVMNIGGNVNITAGTINYSKQTSTVSTITLGDAGGTGGTTSVTWTQTGGTVSLTNTTIANAPAGKTVTMSGTKMGDVATGRTLTVNSGATLNCSNYPVTGAGLFTLASGGTIGIGSAAGIESTGATGNIQVTGTRSYNAGATYRYYEGLTPQVTGNFTSTTNPNIANLIIDKSGATDIVNITKGTSPGNSFNVTNNVNLLLGELNLNDRTLTVTNALPAGITRTSGYVKSETNAATNNSILQWNIVSDVDPHVFPFGVNSTDYIPVTFDGSGAVGNISISTRPSDPTTPEDNQPWPAVVTTMAGIGTEITSAADRWWEITSSVASPLPAVSLTLNYLGTENSTTTSPTDTRGVQHWNSTSSCWDNGANGGCGTVATSSDAGVTTNVGTVAVTGITYFSPFVVIRGAAPLPIELLNFNAYPVIDIVQLNWITATEINNDYFTVERSKDGTDFTTVTTVDGAGNSREIRNYATIDREPYPGVSYYRLKQTDFDGKFTYSNIVAVNIARTFNFSVKPNPVQNNIYVSFTNSEETPMVVTIYSSIGQLVFGKQISATKGNNEIAIEFSLFQQGVYVIRISSEWDSYYEKVVKE